MNVFLIHLLLYFITTVKFICATNVKKIAEGKETQKLDQTFLFLYHDVMDVNTDTHNSPCLKAGKQTNKCLLFKIKAYY